MMTEINKISTQMEDLCSVQPQIDNLRTLLKRQERAFGVLYTSMTPQQQIALMSEYPELVSAIPNPSPACSYSADPANDSVASAAAVYQNPVPQYQNPAPYQQNLTPQYQNPAPQYQNPALQYQNPAPQYRNPTSQYMNPAL